MGALFHREWICFLAQGRFFGLNILYYLMACLMLSGHATPPILWGILTLLLFLTAPRLFEEDMSQGHMELLMLLPLPFWIIIMTKIVLYWIFGVLPLVGILGFLSGGFQTWHVVGSLNLTLLGALGASLAQRGQNKGILTSLILLPLSVPLVLLLTTQDDAILKIQESLLLGYFFFITPVTAFIAPISLRQEIASR